MTRIPVPHSHPTPLSEYLTYGCRDDRRLIEGCREGFKQILNWWESAHARFGARPSCT